MLEPITLTPTLFNQTVVVPGVSTSFGFRNDLKINKKHTLVANFQSAVDHRILRASAAFRCPRRAYRTSNSNQSLQITETALINERTISETRLQLSHSIFKQVSQNALPALFVSEAFSGGGSQVGAASNTQDRGELQNFTSWTAGHHFLKVGGRVRYVKIKSISPSNFGGSYTFSGGTGPTLDANDQLVPGAPLIQLTSLERYRRTLLFQRQNLTSAQIRLLGGGATQFSINGGHPEAGVTQTDVGFYLQDEWKVRPNFTLSPGLRYENQTNIDSNFNFAPRLGFAWMPSFGHRKTPAVNPKATDPKAVDPKAADAKPGAAPAKAPAAPSQPKTVIRGGAGIFYTRFSENSILQTIRFNGVNQQQFVVTDPEVLNLFPAIPPVTPPERLLSAAIATCAG